MPLEMKELSQGGPECIVRVKVCDPQCGCGGVAARFVFSLCR